MFVTPDYVKDMEWLEPTFARIGNLFTIEATDYGHASPDPELVAEALMFFSTVLTPDAAPPSLAPLNDGGIQAEWHCGGLDVEVIFSADPDERGIFVRDKETGGEHDLPLTHEAFTSAVGARLNTST